MKTAISLPDDLAQTIEGFIQKAQMSRSEFFQRAAAAYLARQSRQAIVNNLNEIYTEEEKPFQDVTFHRAALAHFRSLQEREEW